MSINLSEENANLVDELQEEFETIQRRIRESHSQLEQSRAEIDRWEQEMRRANYQLQQVHDNFDTVPRPDIRVAYDSVIEAKGRLLTMRAQQEKLEDTLEQLDHYGDIFQRLLQTLHGHQLGAGDEDDNGSGPAKRTLSPAGETVVRIVQAQEDERKALAKSLHDGPAQSLSNFILQAEVCQRLFDRNPDRASSELNNLKSAASDSFQKVRDFIFDLRPMMLDDLGLIPTLRRYTENIRQKQEITIEFNATGEERRISHHTEVMMFRNIQTLLNLSRVYLAAETIRIQVDIGIDEVRARVEDDGKGFAPEIDLDPSQGDSDVQVLNALRDRVELVGGEMDIYSAEGEGSRFMVLLPIYEEAPEL